MAGVKSSRFNGFFFRQQAVETAEVIIIAVLHRAKATVLMKFANTLRKLEASAFDEISTGLSV